MLGWLMVAVVDKLDSVYSYILNGYCTKIKKRLYRDYIPPDLIIVCCLNPLTGMVAIVVGYCWFDSFVNLLYAVLTASLKKEMILNWFGPN